VVTGHKPDGKATVLIDEISKDHVSFRKGADVYNIWSTKKLPRIMTTLRTEPRASPERRSRVARCFA